MSGVAAPRIQNGRTSLAIDNLRALVILLVLAFHSSLAYLAFLPPQPFAFDQPPFMWRAFPIIDSRRWLGLDLFCAWQDIFLMTLFFFLSGLFVWRSLQRKGVCAFVADRVRRLGIPFVLVVALLMPLAQYPTYLQTAADPSIAAYIRQFLALPIWPSGPMWFLWLLLSA
ncbi:MAG TPA: acyltransferase family protein, partial [Stellaceae bacterium]|nr:acyltransferase family protein [Stellaceae bacterium]